MTSQDPDRLRELGQRLDEIQTRQVARAKRPPPSGWGVAGRFATELLAGLIVGGGLGWGLDWLCGHFGFHTRPVLMLVFVVLGAAAGIRNIICAAQDINAENSANEEK
ncbi:MAG: AtpZ/AtpI family protein [Pseudomonadota bacterium]